MINEWIQILIFDKLSSLGNNQACIVMANRIV